MDWDWDWDWEIAAAPIVQIFSVYLSTEFDDGRPCEVYGSIRATQAGGTTIDLYDRDPADSETIRGHGTLSLTGPGDDSILGSKEVAVDIYFKDKIRDIELIKGRHYLNPTSDDSYDRLVKAVFEGEHSCVYLYYTTFRFGINAIVNVAIACKGDGVREYDDVYGTLVAYYSNNRQYCNSDDEVKYFQTLLFEKPPEKGVRSLVGTPLKLLRSVVAVPACSSLIVKARLFGSQGQFTGSAVFPACPSFESAESIPSENGRLELEVTVKWTDVYPQMYKEAKVNYWATAEDPKDEQSRTEEASKEAPVLPHEQLTSYSDGNDRALETPGLKNAGYHAPEIFSVYVGGINSEVSAICGTIEVIYARGPTLIYDKGPDDPEVLNDDKLARIGGNVAFRNLDFIIVIDLKDPIKGHQICRGECAWSEFRATVAHSMLWYDKRICSVIRGKHGYAAVHYTIFKSAVKATLEVLFFSNDFAEIPHSLHGTLSALYSGHEYSTDLEKKCYQSRLFNRPVDKAVQVSSASSVPLSKSVVIVPTTSSLIVEADLNVTWNGNSHEILSGKEVFDIDLSITRKEFQGRFSYIVVSVKFESMRIV